MTLCSNARLPRCVLGFHAAVKGNGSFASPFGPGTALDTEVVVAGVTDTTCGASDIFTDCGAAGFRLFIVACMTDLKWRFKWWPKINSFENSAMLLSLCSLSHTNSGDSGVALVHSSRNLLSARLISATVIPGIAEVA